MKWMTATASLFLLVTTLTACGSDTTTTKETTVIERPTVVHQIGGTPSDVESNCAHGYDNATHSCY